MKKWDWILIVGIGAGKGNPEYVSLDLTKNTLNRQYKYLQKFGKNLGDYPSSNFTNFYKCTEFENSYLPARQKQVQCQQKL